MFSCRDPGYSFKSPYALESGKETGMWLLLQHGTSPKHMPISLVSNQRFTEVSAAAQGYVRLVQLAFHALRRPQQPAAVSHVVLPVRTDCRCADMQVPVALCR